MDDVLVKCPNCGIKDLDLRAYTSMMVLSNTQALFTVYCNHCNIPYPRWRTSLPCSIPMCIRQLPKWTPAWDARSNNALGALAACSPLRSGHDGFKDRLRRSIQLVTLGALGSMLIMGACSTISIKHSIP